MIVLSLFDGMGCGYEALKRAGIYVEKYYASEIDPWAMKIAKKNHPDIIHLGDVQKWQDWDIDKPDLIIGGSPCQGFSFAGGQLAFDDPRSKLFFEMTDIIDYFRPEFKLLENVKMQKKFLDIITDFMNCGEPHFINSALVSAQNRQRYYWYNWDAPDPVDRGLLLKDIIEYGVVDREKSFCIDANYYKGGSLKNYLEKSRRQVVLSQSKKRLMIGVAVTKNGIRPYKNDGKKGSFSEIGTIATSETKVSTVTVANTPKISINSSETEIHYRKLTPVECERLQTLPDGYTEGVSNTQRYKMLGNGWTIEVLAHIFTHLPLNDFERIMQ